MPEISASEILARLAPQLPNLLAIDLECCDMSNRIIRNILNNCKKVRRLNLDSSTRLNFYSFNLMVQDWNKLRHLNLSCCTEMNELSAKLLIENLKELESLNLCGTRINGRCLVNLNTNLKRLDISYCWNVQLPGLLSLARAPCKDLIELSVNNFDFADSDRCMAALFNKFQSLRYLQMSIGPCVAHDYFIDRVTSRGFSAIAKIHTLESLTIEKICTVDNQSLIDILKGCPKLKSLKLNLGWLNLCTDVGFSQITNHLPNLEELHIMYPSALTTLGISNIVGAHRLRSLSLVNTDIDNDIFKFIEELEWLTKINFDDCRKITLRGLNHLCRIANKRPDSKIYASLLGTGIIVARLKARRNFPPNLKAQISNFRATKYHMLLPPPVIDV